jgi:predicted transcriptional regulator
MQSKGKSVSVRLDDDTLERLETLAKTMDRPRAWVMAQAIRQYVEAQSWQVAAIQQATERIHKGEAKFAAHEEVEAWLETWGNDDEKAPPECR